MLDWIYLFLDLSLEAHGDAFRQLIITKCVPEYFNDRLFNGIFGGMF